VSFRIRSPRLILALLTALNLLNYVDRYVLPAVIEPLQVELGLSSFMAGLLFTVFLIGYFGTSPIFGVLGDRVGPTGKQSRRGWIAAGVAVWSVATITTGLARSVGALVASRTVVGVGEASYATLAPTLIDEVAPPRRLTRWMAIYSAATPIGGALGYIVGGKVMAAYGWRSAFFFAGAPGVVAALLCLLIVEQARPPRLRAPHLIGAAAQLARIPLYRGSVVGYCAHTFAVGGFAFWAPKYLHQRYGLALGDAATRFGALAALGGAVGALAGGLLADRIARAPEGSDLHARSTDEAITRANLRLCAAGTAMAVPLAAGAILAPTAGWFFSFFFPCQIAVFLLSGPINIALLRSAPPHLRASAMAVAIFSIHALGDLWSPPIIGLVADYAPMFLAMLAVPPFFALATIAWARAIRTSGWLTWAARVR